MTGTLREDGFKLSEVTTSVKEGTVSEFESDDHAFGLLMSDVNGYSPPNNNSTLQDKLHKITMLNGDFAGEEASLTPLSVSGIEANDVCSLYKQFVEYEASDEALSYPDSSVMSPMYSPNLGGEDAVLGTLMSVQEKLIEQVGENGSSSPFSSSPLDTAEDLIVCYPNQDNILRTVNGIHPKSDSHRMADSPKFAKLKKKKQNSEPPLRNLSLPVTPRCTSPTASETMSQEERKHMEIKLIKALAQPISKNTPKQNKNCKDSLRTGRKSKDGLGKKPTPCPNKRKLLGSGSEPIPSRLIPVVSKRFKNNLEQSKNMKDPRLKDQNGMCADPRLGKADYCLKQNTVLLKLTNIGGMDFASTNTAAETVDPMCAFDATVDHGSLVKSYGSGTPLPRKPVSPIVSDVEGSGSGDVKAVFNDAQDGLEHGIIEVGGEEVVKTTSESTGNVTSESASNVSKVGRAFGCLDVDQLVRNGSSSVMQIIEFPSLAAIEVKTERSGQTVEKHGYGTVHGLTKDATEMLVGANSTVSSNVRLSSIVNGPVSSAVNQAVNGGAVGADGGGVEVIVGNNSGVNGVVNGSVKAAGDGGVDGVVNGAVNGAVNGVVNGAVNGALNGAVNGAVSSTINGVVNGAVNSTINGTLNRTVNGSQNRMVKPKKTYRKGRSKTPGTMNGNLTSDSENEYDDDDRAYNRKHSKKTKNNRTLPLAYIKTEKCSSRPRSTSKTPNTSRPASRQHSRSPTFQVRSVCHRRRSGSPDSTLRSPSDEQYRSDEESEFAYHSDRSDCENMDISNKLIELSNPVPYDIENERKLRFLTGHASKSIGERRNIYAGGIAEDTTKAQLAERFKRFGKIEKITQHFREKGDNYAFIVFEEPDNAMRAIEEGNDDPSYPRLDLCFGGRRKFVGGSYVDFDGNNRYLEESEKGSIDNRIEPPEDDFDNLLRRALTETKKKEEKKLKREKTPEWT